MLIFAVMYLHPSQNAPVQPGAQVQMNPPIMSMQLAPFLHGLVEHACSATKNNVNEVCTLCILKGTISDLN